MPGLNPPTARNLRESLEDLLEAMIREEGSRVYSGGFRKGGVIVLEDYRGPVAVIGDIHGDHETFNNILLELERLNFMDNGLIVLLGDYVDRGPPEGQVHVIAKIAELKKSMDWRLAALRGNHEPPVNLKPYPHDYPYALKELYGLNASELYELSSNLFNMLPHALILKGVALMLHGGPPTVLRRELLEYLGWDRRLSVIEEMLWNDPTEMDVLRAPSPRGAGVLWGPKVTEHALKVTNTRTIIRGHEPAYEGYRLNHGGRVVTLFSRLGSPYYNEKAAYIACHEEELKENTVSCIRDVGTRDGIEVF